MNYIEQFWRDAKPEDAIKEPRMVARFRDYGDSSWMLIDYLIYWNRSEAPWIHSYGYCYEECQVYDPPAGFEIGEGWRLVDKEKDTPQSCDEIYEGARNRWIKRSHVGPYDRELIYRRRIEPPKPKYVPCTWEDREQLRGRWIRNKETNEELLIATFYTDDDGRLRSTGRSSDYLYDCFIFCDTNEPVGKKVTQ
jgi:hypothetical protein